MEKNNFKGAFEMKSSDGNFGIRIEVQQGATIHIKKERNENILIIGANGFTGRRILNDLSVNPIYHVTGCSLRDDICPGKDYRFVRTDIRDENEVRKLFKECRPDIVINTSALSVPDYCETHHAEAEATNVTAVETIAHVCEQYGSRFIHLSTDFVFDGKSTRLYKEEDEAIPVNYYGVTKLKAEKIIASICSNYAIVRVVVVYGKALPGQHGNILQLVANRLRNGETIRVVSDQWRTPTFVGDISVGVEKLMFHTANGIYHISRQQNALTIAEIAYRVADFLKLDRSLIEPVTTEEMKEVTPRPRFSGLSIEKAKAEIGYTRAHWKKVWRLLCSNFTAEESRKVISHLSGAGNSHHGAVVSELLCQILNDKGSWDAPQRLNGSFGTPGLQSLQQFFNAVQRYGFPFLRM